MSQALPSLAAEGLPHSPPQGRGGHTDFRSPHYFLSLSSHPSPASDCGEKHPTGQHPPPLVCSTHQVLTGPQDTAATGACAPDNPPLTSLSWSALWPSPSASASPTPGAPCPAPPGAASGAHAPSPSPWLWRACLVRGRQVMQGTDMQTLNLEISSKEQMFN